MRLSPPGVSRLLVVVAVAVAAGCGSDDDKDGSGSHAELVEQANAICRKADAPSPAKDTAVGFDSLRELKDLYRGDAARARRAGRALGSLRPSEADRPKLRALRKSFTQLVLTNEEAGGITALPQIRVFGAITVAANRVAFERATALGARHCPPLTASGSYLAAVNRNKKAGDPVPPPASERTEERGRPAEEAEAPEAEDEGGHPVVGRWKGRVTQYGPGDFRKTRTNTIVLRSATVGESAGRIRSGPGCLSNLQVEAATARSAVFRETLIRGKGRCYDVTYRIRVERRGARLTYRSTGRTPDGRLVLLGTLARSP